MGLTMTTSFGDGRTCQLVKNCPNSQFQYQLRRSQETVVSLAHHKSVSHYFYSLIDM